jgi:hypothetical protein
MRSLVAVVVGCAALTSSTLPAQEDSVSRPARTGISALTWVIPLGVVASAGFDEEAREGALHSHSRSLDRLAKVVNPLGTAQRLVPAIAVTFLGAKVSGQEELAMGTVNTAAGYIASDMVESLLKPIVGRERPHVEGNSRRFRPFTRDGDWHSFPSAHVAHITSIVEAISSQTHSTAVSAAGSVVVSLMGWDRIYEDQHWASDVAATVFVSSLVSGATVRWLTSHWTHSADAASLDQSAVPPSRQ